MRSLAVALACILVGLSLARVSAQSPSAPPALVVTPASGDITAEHQVHGERFPVSVPILVVLFDPNGNQSLYRPQSDDQGTFDLTLSPSGSAWSDGLYRVVAGLSDGRSTSATFTASDGQPHLYAQPYLPSPSSAFNFVATGLTPQTPVRVHVWLTGGNLGERDFVATTDATGSFSMYAWPEQVGTPFFPAGQYRVSVDQFGLSTTFWVREHPNSATIDVPSPVQPDQRVPVSFSHYTAQRMLWGVWAGPDGTPGGEFLVGPTDPAGAAQNMLSFADLGAGQYYIATPYDWGETTFTVVEPTPTATMTATATATATPHPTPTKKPTAVQRPTAVKQPTPKPKPTVKRPAPKPKCWKGKDGRKHCKKR